VGRGLGVWRGRICTRDTSGRVWLGKGGRREEGKDLQMRKRNEDDERRVLNFEMGSNSVTDAILFKFVGRYCCCYENSEGMY
jgi:hypothetical protein